MSASTDLQHFPFSAVVGQDTLKTALCLAAIDPHLGGVLISGPRGCAKSTLARSLADLLTTGQHEPTAAATANTHQPFINLPLGASEERLTGSLDLEQVLGQGDVSFKPGLLAKAHGGILYVDEVNLLADSLVDLLLDVAASGQNHVERDGLSHTHAAEFVLIGTMNPDEGELRPQLQDRFGLAIELGHIHDPQLRVHIARQRRQFDQNPQAFIEQYQPQQQQLRSRLAQARQQLANVELDEAHELTIAQRCIDAAVDGMRADIIWQRAAIAHAAWQQRLQVTDEDIDAVSELVLVHRRQAGSPPSSSPPSSSDSSSDQSSDQRQQPNNGQQPEQNRRPPETRRPPSTLSSTPSTDASDTLEGKQNGESNSKDEQSDSADGDWGAMAPVQQRQIDSVNLPADTAPHLSKKQQPQAKGLSASSNSSAKNLQPSQQPNQWHQTGHRGQSRLSEQGNIDWFTTLTDHDNHPRLRTLHRRQRQQPAPALHLVMLDTSASILGGRALAQAKGVIQAIAQSAYLARQQLAVLGFGNGQVRWLLSRRRAPKQLRPFLDTVQAGGGTPLVQALQVARRYLAQLHRQQPGLQTRTYLITDGRSREDLSQLPAFTPGISSMAPRSSTQQPPALWVIDNEQAAVRLGRCQQLATQLAARYFPIQQFTGDVC